MKTKNKVSITTLLLLLIAAMAVPMITYGLNSPSTSPDLGNTVNATFNSVKLANGSYALTGSYGRFVGLTTAGPYDGADVGGYTGAQARCVARFPVASGYLNVHVCSAREIINSKEDLNMPAASGWAWINNGPPGYFSSLSNDCNGWTSRNTESAYYSVYGSKWGFTTNYAKATSCDQKLQIACCSY